MEIIFLQAVSGTCITFIFLLGWGLINLIKTVDKQQEQINHLLKSNNSQNDINLGMVNISQDIAHKVISIEEEINYQKTRIDRLVDGVIWEE